MSQYTPYRKRAMSAQSHGSYYRVPEELKALLVDLTVSLLQHHDADMQQIYMLAAQFLEERLNERNSQSEGRKHDQVENTQNILVESVTQENIIPTISNSKLSEFADHRSKNIIHSAISDYLASSNISQQENVYNQRLGGIRTDAKGNIDMTNVYANLEHPLTIEEVSRCKLRDQEKEILVMADSTQYVALKNVYENLEPPITLRELQMIAGSKSNSNLLKDYLHIYQTYAEKSCAELMKLVYADINLKLARVS